MRLACSLIRSLFPLVFFVAVASAQAFEEGLAVPERLAPVSARYDQALAENLLVEPRANREAWPIDLD